MSYKVVFAGTPGFALNSLESLIQDKRFFVSAIITQEDKKVWRSQLLTPSPVKMLWIKSWINLFQASSKDEISEILKSENPDFFVVVAYGKILSVDSLSIAKFNINIHWSILPKYRWASPIQSAILNWDVKTWISIMNVEEKMDTWSIWKILECEITKEDNSETIFHKLSELSIKLPDILVDIIEWKLQSAKQDEDLVTYCKKINKEDWKINWKIDTAEWIFNKIRAFTPWPWVYASYAWKVIKIIKANYNSWIIESNNAHPWLIFLKDWKIYTQTVNWSLELIKIQLEGKKPLLTQEFTKWHQDFIGSELE